jgi:predicted nuclease of predicted toxin-antitoxin system
VRLLLDEMFPPSVAEGLRRRGIDAVAIQETPSMRGLPDPEVFVAAQLDERCLVTENVPDFVQVEAAWRSEQEAPHHGLVLVAPGAFPRHHRQIVGRLVKALAATVEAGCPEPGTVGWLQPPPR